MQYMRAVRTGKLSGGAVATNVWRSVSVSGGDVPDGAVIFTVDIFAFVSGYGTTHTVTLDSGPVSLTNNFTFSSSELSGTWLHVWQFLKTDEAPDYNTKYTASQFTSAGILADSNLFLKNDSSDALNSAMVVHIEYFEPDEPTPPTTMTFSKTRPAPSDTVNVSWSGMSFGTHNSVVRYELWRATNGSTSFRRIYSGIVAGTSVQPNQTYSGSYWYKARVVVRDWNNVEHESELSSAFKLQTMDRTAPSAPTSVLIDGKAASGGVSTSAGVANSDHTLRWSGAAAGQGNAIGTYEVWRSETENGTYTRLAGSLTGTEYTVKAHATMGKEYWYKVKTVGKDDTSKASDLSTARARLQTLTVTATTPPTAVTIDNKDTLSAKAGTAHTLRWSGAAAGTNNAITGYEILRSTTKGSGYETLASVAAGTGSYSVNASDGDNVTYYYRVKTLGTYQDSVQSTAVAEMTSYVLCATSTPDNVRLSATCVQAGGTATLMWDRSTPGQNAVITEYRVYRSMSPGSGYALIGTTEPTVSQMVVEAHASEGATYYYKVQAGCSDPDADSQMSAYAALTSNQSPTQPVQQSGAVSHSQRPRIMVTLGNDPEEELMTLSAEGFAPSRASGLTSGDKVLLRKNTAGQSGVVSAAIREQDPHGGEAVLEAEVEIDLCAWTDTPVEAGSTQIKAAHITELQEAVDDMCAYYKIPAREWTPCRSGETSTLLWHTHISEIISGIRAIAERVNDWDEKSGVNNILLGALEPTRMPTAATINQLRDIIEIL